MFEPVLPFHVLERKHGYSMSRLGKNLRGTTIGETNYTHDQIVIKGMYLSTQNFPILFLELFIDKQ